MLRGLNRAEEQARRVGKVLQPLAPYLNEGPAAAAETPPRPPMPPLRYLRPPGALPEELLAQTCSQCGECVRVCPARCIQLAPPTPAPDSTSENSAEPPPRAGGLPYIVPRQSPCVVCDDLSCMKVCPTGALKLVESIAQIRMGIAIADPSRCLRGPSGEGEDCQLCITPCPVGATAIGLDERGRVQVREGCIGCGVCERACPTEPASIWVEPL